MAVVVEIWVTVTTCPVLFVGMLVAKDESQL